MIAHCGDDAESTELRPNKYTSNILKDYIGFKSSHSKDSMEKFSGKSFSGKSKGHSFGSFVHDSPRTEFIGIRKFARNHMRPPFSRDTNSSSHETTSTDFNDATLSKGRDNSSWRFFPGASQRGLAYDDFKSAQGPKTQTLDNLEKTSTCQFDTMVGFGESSTSKCEKRFLRFNSNIQNLPDQVAACPNPPKDIPRRVVSLYSLPEKASLSCILAQVRGGPLERIGVRYGSGDVMDDEPVDWSSAIVDLHFWRPTDADAFMEYATTGMFMINGKHVKAEWGATTVDQESSESTGSALELMADSGARRTLIFKKLIQRKISKHALNVSSRGYPSPTSHLSTDFDIDEVVKDFQQYGEIVEIAPVISRKLCFAVQFNDVRAAIMAKYDCENVESTNEYSPLFDKYKKWNVWYGKDPADKPCYPKCV
ncbi:unnamed protein product [Kuraishia capsulata CBS 1993]|uniref:Uncharacterized protein n=1 Tax=Kuraishia capsulata CBS 1993 TaxID=1382522 RepID=W6MUJ4_9ASCO|nr:uncharacterized protein KUCA_T00001650001 [Kuraishia capsulata CBS 1993]CDK25680.1 unnamed protein product [Kuraishia capsulata CBS 1993]